MQPLGELGCVQLCPVTEETCPVCKGLRLSHSLLSSLFWAADPLSTVMTSICCQATAYKGSRSMEIYERIQNRIYGVILAAQKNLMSGRLEGKLFKQWMKKHIQQVPLSCVAAP